MKWLRLYTEVLSDPKVQRLPAEDFRHWINILCVASVNDGVLPHIEDVAFALRLSNREAKAMVTRLTKALLIDPPETDDSCGSPHGWDARQYRSDNSTERVKRFRKRIKLVSVTPPDSDADSDSEILSLAGGKR